MTKSIMAEFKGIEDMNNRLKDMLMEAYGTKLEVTHDRFPENEILINADCWCDIGSHKVPEFMMQSVQGDASVCADCYDHFN